MIRYCTMAILRQIQTLFYMAEATMSDWLVMDKSGLHVILKLIHYWTCLSFTIYYTLSYQCKYLLMNS